MFRSRSEADADRERQGSNGDISLIETAFCNRNSAVKAVNIIDAHGRIAVGFRFHIKEPPDLFFIAQYP